MAFSHLPRGLGHFADNNGISQNQPLLFELRIGTSAYFVSGGSGSNCIVVSERTKTAQHLHSPRHWKHTSAFRVHSTADVAYPNEFTYVHHVQLVGNSNIFHLNVVMHVFFLDAVQWRETGMGRESMSFFLTVSTSDGARGTRIAITFGWIPCTTDPHSQQSDLQ